MNNNISVNIGEIVIANYLDFEGEIRQGMFLVIGMNYTGVGDRYNLTTLKISTSARNYQVLLKSDFLKFLHYDSYVNCTDLQKISTTQVLSVAGKVNNYVMNLVKKQVKNSMRDYYTQMDDFLSEAHPYCESYKVNPRRGGLTLDGTTLMLDGKPLTKEMLKNLLMQD